ncbi:exported protein of unknown function [Vibrio tapetis subsp. tapetis]|uniref:Uncharacterized protein n=1 Tax=Vibrio tapetis subsp. tapetis TaxID=1671868 RepID=A0A2N8ZH79_9VIBR|nr:exported protein of unknown function [Vibrio tapetis subsp. tapetis]
MFCVGLVRAVCLTKFTCGVALAATGAATKLLRRRDALQRVCENLTEVGRISLPNSQAYPLPN